MKFQQLYSSSSGNLYEVIANNGLRLLIDPGVTWRKVQAALNYDLTNIAGALCSHEHADHSKAVKEVMQAGISVAASQGTLEALGIADNRKTMALTPLQGHSPVDDDSIQVFPFPISHDAVEPFGFVICVDGEDLLFATDTSHITQQFSIKFSIIAIECSYDKDILQKRVDTKDIDESLAKRLLTSHMEKQEAMRYLSEFCDLSKCGEIHLLHLSGDNIDKEQTKMDFEKKFFIETRIK